ncbi:MAG: cyclic nucleotide-binding domain-containing protein [Acidobacteriia bacterium]|nr:cyclic nucleotide-binding domain-containing protein [Terriglobia bacterium]
MSFTPGQCVFKAGDRGDAMYIVIEGELKILVGSATVEIAGPGSIFGEMALIDDAPRSATVVAKTRCRLVAVDRGEFQYMVSEGPFFALEVMKVIADRLRKMDARLRSKANQTRRTRFRRRRLQRKSPQSRA